MNQISNNFKINFYNNVELLIDTYAQYLIQSYELLNNNEQDEINEENIKILDHNNYNLKFLSHKIHIQMLTLNNDEKTKQEEEKIFHQVMNKKFIEKEHFDQYIIFVTKFLNTELGDIDFKDVAGNF